MDLAYYLFTSVKPDVRRTYLKDLLKEYLASFKSTCELLNAECSVTFDVSFNAVIIYAIVLKNALYALSNT